MACRTEGGRTPEEAEAANQDSEALTVASEGAHDQPSDKTSKVTEESADQQFAASSAGASKDDLMSLGQTVYEGHCLSCHQASGEGIDGMFPAIKGSAVANGPVSGHINLILNGKPPLMASFRNVLKPEEIAAVITYQRNALGNSTGDIVQASDVASHQ